MVKNGELNLNLKLSQFKIVLFDSILQNMLSMRPFDWYNLNVYHVGLLESL